MESHNTPIPIVVFSYKIQDILTEVTRRTSYLGKMRNTETTPNLIDRISLTEGERFLFDEFLDDAVQQTYDWLKVFGRNMQNACQVVSEYQDHLEYKDYGVISTLTSSNNTINPICVPFTIPCNATPDYSNNKIKVDVPQKIQLKTIIPVNVNYLVATQYKIKTKLADTLPCEEIIKKNKIGTCNTSTKEIDLSTILDFQFNEAHFRHVLSAVEVSVYINTRPITKINYKKGDYIEYHSNLTDTGVSDIYQITDDCSNQDWVKNAVRLETDPRGRIVYSLEQTDCFDRNMIPNIDRSIKEAIINYIMYRWLTYTKPDESDIYMARFEEYAQRAKLGMESETSVQQRRYKIF